MSWNSFGESLTITTFGESHERTDVVLDRLVELYEAWGKPDRAEVYQRALTTASE